MIIEPPDKGWVVHTDEDIDNACNEDGVWSAPEISTDHYVLDSDTAAFAYGKHFLGRVSGKWKFSHSEWVLKMCGLNVSYF